MQTKKYRIMETATVLRAMECRLVKTVRSAVLVHSSQAVRRGAVRRIQVKDVLETISIPPPGPGPTRRIQPAGHLCSGSSEGDQRPVPGTDPVVLVNQQALRRFSLVAALRRSSPIWFDLIERLACSLVRRR